MPPGDPYAAMKRLVQQLKSAGLSTVTGDVLIDTSLFDEYTGWRASHGPQC